MGQTGLEHSNPLQCSCLENPTDRGAWQATIYGVARSWTRLKPLSRHSRYWQTLPLVLYPGDGHSAGQKLQVPVGCPRSQAEDGQRCWSTSAGWSPGPRPSPCPCSQLLFSPRPPASSASGIYSQTVGSTAPMLFPGMASYSLCYHKTRSILSVLFFLLFIHHFFPS